MERKSRLFWNPFCHRLFKSSLKVTGPIAARLKADRLKEPIHLYDGKLDRSFTYTGIGNRSATYTNLDPGKYFFRFKASNNDGVWN